MTWGLLELGMIAWILFAGLASVAITLLLPLLRRVVRGLHPELRSVCWRALLVAPAIGGLIATALCFAPKVLHPWWPEIDHCTGHADAHVHFCLEHPPARIADAELGAVLLGLGVLALVTLAVRVRRMRGASRLLGTLAHTAEHDPSRGVWILESAAPIAMSVGALRARTLISRGLLQSIPARMLDVVIEHERAHERRRDGSWRVFTDLCSWGHLPTTARALRRELDLACEQACDERAASHVGDRVRVAEALLAVARLDLGESRVADRAFAFGAHSVGIRVASLLEPSVRSLPGRRTCWGLMALGTVLLLGIADPLHHWTETLLHHLLG